MEKTYSTSELAALIGIHPNTVRLYEKLGFISCARRLENGYRVFTEEHLLQLKLTRIALKAEVLQHGLRKQAINIIQVTAQKDYEKSESLTDEYIDNILLEKKLAENAVKTTENILEENSLKTAPLLLTRKQAADYLHITIDTLRNWELNGLFTVKRKQNGYRTYNSNDIKKLTVIKVLRTANYSLSAILRLLNRLENDKSVNISKIIDTPDDSDFIITACDKLITSLKNLYNDALKIKDLIRVLKNINY